jgi:hypothetical protein
MKKTNKVNPLEFFRKSAEARQKAFKTGGANVPKQSLPKKYKGGPGSGMGSMYSDDQAYDALMNTPTPKVDSTNIPSYKVNPSSLLRPSYKSNGYPEPNMEREMIDRMNLQYPNKDNKGIFNKPVKPGIPQLPDFPSGGAKNGGMIYKKGGATKAKKFAALAPPFNKATAADRIVGAKKNARKKK